MRALLDHVFKDYSTSLVHTYLSPIDLAAFSQCIYIQYGLFYFANWEFNDSWEHKCILSSSTNLLTQLFIIMFVYYISKCHITTYLTKVLYVNFFGNKKKIMTILMNSSNKVIIKQSIQSSIIIYIVLIRTAYACIQHSSVFKITVCTTYVYFKQLYFVKVKMSYVS